MPGEDSLVPSCRVRLQVAPHSCKFCVFVSIDQYPVLRSELNVFDQYLDNITFQYLIFQAQGCLVVVDDDAERPFSQTILLMPQGPKKYYAHSDIFQFIPGECFTISSFFRKNSIISFFSDNDEAARRYVWTNCR